MKAILLSLFLSFPLFAAGHPLSQPALAPTAYGTSQPTTAYAGVRFLTVWTEQMGGIGRHFKGAFSDATGRRISPAAFTLIRNVNPEWSQLVSTGDAYVLFWREQNITRMAEIDLLGNVTRTRELELPGFSGEMARVAWNGSRFLIVVRHWIYFPAEHVEGFLFERNGDLVRQREIALDDLASQYAIVPTANGFAVFTVGRDLIAYRVSNDAEVQQTLIESGTGTSTTSIRPLHVAAVNLGNDDVLAVWSSGHYAEAQLRSTIFKRDGSATPMQVITGGTGSLVPFALLRTVGGAVLAYTHAPSFDAPHVLFTTHIGTDGVPTGPVYAGPRVIDPSAASNGHTMLIAGSMNDLISVRRVSTVIVGSDAVVSTPEMLSISPALQMQPALTAAGGRLLAAWTDLEGDAAVLRSAVVTANAEVQQRNTIGAAFLASDELSWNGSEALAVAHANQRLLARRIDANGVAIDPEPLVISNYPLVAHWQRAASVAWTGDRWLIVWPANDSIVLASVSRGGVLSAPRTLPVTSALPPDLYRYVEAPEIASDGTRVLLVWRETRSEICYFPICNNYESFVFARSLTREGEVIASDPLSLPSLTSASNFSIATSGNEFVILGGPQAASIDARGGTLRLLATREFFGAASDVTWDGREYVIALRYQLLRMHLAVHRVNAMLEQTSAPRGTETLPSDQMQEPSIASIDATQSMIAITEGDADTGARAVVYRESELPLLVARAEPPQNVRTQRVNGVYELTWDAPSGEVELYHVEALTPHGWIWVAQVPADVRSARSQYPVMRVRAINAGGYSDFATPLARNRSVRH